MPHTGGLADTFGDSVNGRSGVVAGIVAALWNREDESAALSPLPDRREIFAAQGPKDDFGSCIFEHNFEPRGVLDPFTAHQVRLIVDVDLPCPAKPRAECPCERLHQLLFKMVCLVLFHFRSFVSRLHRIQMVSRQPSPWVIGCRRRPSDAPSAAHQKLGVHNRADAVARARERGLI